MTHSFDTKKLLGESSNNPITDTYTCGSTASLLVFHITAVGGSRAGGVPTFNGVELTQAGSTITSAEGSTEIWYLLAPPVSSSYTVSIPNTGTLSIQVTISSYVSTSGQSNFDGVQTASGTSTNPTVSITPSKDGCVIVDSMFSGYANVASANNQNLLYKKQVI